MQGDVTRVMTFQLARETSNRTYTEIGVPDPHHPLTHHGNDPDKIARMAKINAFHVSLFAYFLEKLKATPEGDGSLLDHGLFLYGSGMGNPNVHDHVNLPILVAGGAAGQAEGRAPHPVRRADAAGESAPDAARAGRCPSRCVRRQQGQGRRAALALDHDRSQNDSQRCVAAASVGVEPLSARSTGSGRVHSTRSALAHSTGSGMAGPDAPLADAAEKSDRARVRALLKQRADVKPRRPTA